jgi:hypothetical protein
MREAFVVHKVAEILDKGPALTPQMRAEIERLLAAREVPVVASSTPIPTPRASPTSSTSMPVCAATPLVARLRENTIEK